MEAKPRRVKAKITRLVTEIAFVTLDRQGNIEEYDEFCAELDSECIDLIDIKSVLSVHD